MARYTYNAGLVTQTIDTLYTACDCLDNTNVDMKKGIDMILNARGAENINIDFTPITGYQSTVVEYIELMTNELQKKAQEIEEYQDAPWYKKLFATIGMGALKIVEGLATFVENIGDGLVSIAGFVGGIFSSEFKNSVAEFVRTDYVGETTAKWYEEGWLKDVNKYSVMSHQSTAANILKGVGTATGYVLLAVATGGAGAAVSTGVAAGAALVGGIGSGTQGALKQAQLTNPEMTAGEAFNSAFGQGVKQGAIAAGTTLLTAGIAKGIGNAAKSLSSSGGKINMFTKVVDKIDDAGKVIDKIDDASGAVDDLVGVGKAVNSVKLGVNKVADKLLNNTVGKGIIKGANKILTGSVKVVDDAAGAISKKAGENIIGNFAGKIAKNGTAIVTNTLGSVAGATAGGQFKNNIESSTIDQYIQEVQNPSVGQQLYVETQEVLASDEAKPGVATPEEAAQNLQNLQNQGYNPGSNSTPEAPTTETPQTPVTTPANNTPTSTGGNSGSSNGYNGGNVSGGSSGSYGGGSTGSTPTVTVDPVEVPDYTPSTPENNNTVSTPDQTPPSTTNKDDIVSNINPGVSNNGGNSNGGSSSGTGGSAVSSVVGSTDKIENITSETQGSEVLNTFGDVSGAFTGISSPKSNIPTSSSPILSSTNKDGASNSFVPLGAGLGAASIAGIGAKAYMDKREKAKETENDEIETEEWSENDNVEIDYGVENTEEADYLSPTDELAFTE